MTKIKWIVFGCSLLLISNSGYTQSKKAMMKKPAFVPKYYMITPNVSKSELRVAPQTYEVVEGEQEAMYFGRQRMENVDFPSFKVYSQEYYAVDKYTVYYKGVAVYRLQNNDFKYLGDDYVSYGQKVYYHNQPVSGIDYDSVRYMGDFCIVDKNSVYLRGKQLIGADPDTFEVFNNKFARDKNSVYFMGVKIPDLDSANFVMLNDEVGKDLHFVYSNTRKITGADAATFRVIDSFYGEDKHAIYSLYNLLTIKHADRDTFQVLGFGYAKDKNYVYEFGKIVKGVNPKTFVLDIPPIQY